MFHVPRPVFRVTELESRFVPSATYAALAASPPSAAPPASDPVPVQVGTNEAGEAVFVFEVAPSRCRCAMCGSRVAVALAPAVTEPVPAVADPAAEVIEPAPMVAIQPAAPAPTVAAPTVAFPVPVPAVSAAAPSPEADAEPVVAEPFAVFAAADFEPWEEPDRVVAESAAPADGGITLFNSPFDFLSPLAG